MAELPLILIGPVLRRVEPRSVSVFVATSKPAAVHLSIYEGVVDAGNPPPEHASADAHTMACGAQFHAIVLTAHIDGPAVLMPGHRYSYDLRITAEGGAPRTLHDEGLLGDRSLPFWGDKQPANFHDPGAPDVEVCAIGYGDGRLPSFVTCPVHLEDLVLAHCSCRKPHGAGQPALQWLDHLIDGLDGSVDGYPHMLFLTGDQIYADDVAAALLPGINTLGIALISSAGATVEQVPSPLDGGSSLNVSTNVLPAEFRQRMMGKAGFTSEEAPSHLIGFGEWLAMYCIAWNPDVWPLLAVADHSQVTLDDELTKALDKDAARVPSGVVPEVVLGRPSPDAAEAVLAPLYGAPDENHKALLGRFSAFLTDKQRLDAFRREVPNVRRLIANVPVYMICDDHEVSDDWFLTGAIRKKTTDKEFGRTVLRNALAAYTICQAWGDDPALWTDDADHQKLLNGIAGMFGHGWAGGPGQKDACDDVDAILGLHPNLAPKIDFSFTVDGPAHRVRVLDTRTRRFYSTDFASPGLLTSEALDHQLPLDEDLPPDHPLIIVSPAPVFGPPLLTEIIGVLGAAKNDVSSLARSITERSSEENVTGLSNGQPLGMQFFDAEHWAAYPPTFERLLERLSHHERVVVLGGDVHYGAAFEMDWTGDGRTSRIIHFTSSAARNEWTGGSGDVVRTLLMVNAMSVGLQRIGLPMLRLGWRDILPPVIADLSGEPPLARISTQTGPVLLTSDMFRHHHGLARPQDWAWSAGPISDVRAAADRPPAARVEGLEMDIPTGAQGVRHYGVLAKAHVDALGKAAVARGLQYLNNVGVIRFASQPNGTHVSQSLYSLRLKPEPNERGDAYVVHESLLEPVAVFAPQELGPVN